MAFKTCIAVLTSFSLFHVMVSDPGCLVTSLRISMHMGFGVSLGEGNENSCK